MPTQFIAQVRQTSMQLNKSVVDASRLKIAMSSSAGSRDTGGKSFSFMIRIDPTPTEDSESFSVSGNEYVS